MRSFSAKAELAEPSIRVNDLERNRQRNCDGTRRNRPGQTTRSLLNWFHTVPFKFHRVVPAYVIENKKWCRWFRDSSHLTAPVNHLASTLPASGGPR